MQSGVTYIVSKLTLYFAGIEINYIFAVCTREYVIHHQQYTYAQRAEKLLLLNCTV